MANLRQINNQQHWDKFYKKKGTFKNSPFSKFVLKFLKKGKNLADIGCGDGRDAIFFFNNNILVDGYDNSSSAIRSNKNKSKKVNFYKKNFVQKKLKVNKKYDYIYARFFIHTLNTEEESVFFKNIIKLKKKNTLFFFEFRTTKDETINKGKKIGENERIYGHYRRFIDVKNFKKKIKDLKFKTIYFKQSSKFSIFKNQKPHLARFILR